jgi:CheY-like chemotaxis protein
VSEPALVMVVDDDQDLRDSICDVLSDAGHATVAFGDPLDGLEYLAAGAPRPALILLDLMMPLMNGVEFRRHQLTDPALAQIPVVLLTADANPDARCSELGARGCLKKPLRVVALLETAQRYAGRSYPG